MRSRENNVWACSRLGWAREIIVVGSGSTDGKVEIATATRSTREIHRVFDSHAAQCNFAIHETGSENYGLVVPEALAADTPVLTTAATPWRQIADEGAGWCVPPNQHAITEALVEAFSLDRPRLDEMGQSGRAFVLASFSWPRVVSDHIALYQWVCGEGPMPAFVS